MSGFRYEKDPEGIVIVTMDIAGPINTFDREYQEAIGTTLDRLEKEPGLKGVIIASAQRSFFAAADVCVLLTRKPGEEAALLAECESLKRQLRRLEKLPVPVVAAINGAALGSGYELAQACHHRIVASVPEALVGQPEVTLGLSPCAGGIVRLVHRLGVEKATPYLLEGNRVKPADALAAGLVDEIVETVEDLIPAAKAWIRSNPLACLQPWDRKGHQVPGGTLTDPQIAQWAMAAAAALNKKTRGLLPAPQRILATITEATLVDFDTALRIESRAFTQLLMSPQAKNLITAFVQTNEVNGGASRPNGIEKSRVCKVGVLGAGMMGQGIAYVAAIAGMEVVLRDVTVEAAQKGKAYSERLLSAAVAKGNMDEARKTAVLERIKPTTTAADLAGSELIIEAVFESLKAKNEVIRETEGFLAASGVYGTNTSTLPVSLLAKTTTHPERFIGIHFFSPVDRMPLVELICGKETSEATLAKAFDFVRQIGKTAIVVNDSLGFFTSRTFCTYLDEGLRLLREGVRAALIENLARQIGMPVPPLAMQDEVSLELTLKIADTHEAMDVLYSKSDTSASTEVCKRMVAEFGRGGRHHGGGFYEYPPNAEKHLWPKLLELFFREEVSVPDEDIKDRLLFRQVIESIKCLEEGVLRSVADGNVGSLLGIGAPTWTGGFLQFVNTYGPARFARRSGELAQRYGSRFTPPQLLLRKAQAGGCFE